MQAYLDLLRTIRDTGHDHPDRTGVGRRSIFGAMLRFDLSNGEFPFITTRYLKPEIFIAETLFFIRGWTNAAQLRELGAKIWDAWSVKAETPVNLIDKLVKQGIVPEEARLQALVGFPQDLMGEIGPMYGAMWRNWPRTDGKIQLAAIQRTVEQLPSDLVKALTEAYGTLPDNVKEATSLNEWLLHNYYSHVDQLNELVCELKTNPWSSRLTVTAANPEYMPIAGFSPDENVLLGRGALAACHTDFQCLVSPPKEEGGKKRLSLRFSLRSWDFPVGAPFNIASYALLLNLLAHVTDMEPYELIGFGTDVHIYTDQLPLIDEQLERAPLPLPKLWLNPEQKDLFAFTPDDIRLEGYEAHPAIKYPVAV